MDFSSLFSSGEGGGLPIEADSLGGYIEGQKAIFQRCFGSSKSSGGDPVFQIGRGGIRRGKRMAGDRLRQDLWKDIREDGGPSVWYGYQKKFNISASPGCVLNCIVVKDHWNDGTNGSASFNDPMWKNSRGANAAIEINGCAFRGIHYEMKVWEVPA